MKKKNLLIFIAMLCLGLVARGQSQYLTEEEAATMFKSISMNRVSIHDPSIVYDNASGQYYVFGTHRGCARSSNLKDWSHFSSPWGTIGNGGYVISNVSNQEAFVTNQTKRITIGGQSVTFGNFDAQAWCAAYGDYSVNGNMWAPDIIYNPVMKKWCQYLSLNGPTWNSCIILLTSNTIEGPYVYQGPVVYTGFIDSSNEAISYKLTDLSLALGNISVMPSRYNLGRGWGNTWPHAIDPCVFYDEDGKLWMAYGSWSGGIWMLELNENTGLRDYDVKYTSDYSTMGASVTSDPYFGKKIAGGHYVSGEGSYIEHIGDYYYLFVTNGGLESNRGYQMRVFRSKNVDGPYVDSKGASAIYTSYALNYGPNSVDKGQKILGSYAGWGNMTIGELSQGHNSALLAEDGNAYLVYHTRFNDGFEGFQLRVHQLFLNRLNWLVAAPFEYTGETVTNEDIATKELFDKTEIVGNYKLLVHRYQLDYANRECVEPVDISLNEDGTITGAYTGKWSTVEGTSYVTITLSNVPYSGVLVEQQMEPTTVKALCFSAVSTAGVNIWGYKIRDKYTLASQLNSQLIPLKDGANISGNIDFSAISVVDGVTMKWTSSAPDVISETGRYNPEGLVADTDVTLSVQMSCGDYFWTKEYNVTAKVAEELTGDYKSGRKAFYVFDETPVKNIEDQTQEAALNRRVTTSRPELMQDGIRSGHYLHQYAGASYKECYTEMVNPLAGAALDEGFTVSMWVKRNDDDAFATLFSFFDSDTRKVAFFTGNTYFGYNDQNGTWLDVNNPNDVESTNIPVGKWTHVAVTVSAEDGISYFINGIKKFSGYKYNGECDGSSFTRKSGFNYQYILDFVKECNNFYFGLGTSYGSAEADFDDLMIFDRILTSDDISTLYSLENRVYDLVNDCPVTAIGGVKAKGMSNSGIYDLSGRKVTKASSGMYIVNGKKILVK